MKTCDTNKKAASAAGGNQDVVYKKPSQGKDVWRRFCKNKGAVLGMCIIICLILVAVFADFVAPYDPIEQNLSNALKHSSREHIFGTDEFGRDIFSRIIYGARISLSIGFCAELIACLLGASLGAIAGFYGGKLDTVIMRVMDVFLALPTMLLNLAIVAVLGASVINMILAVGLAVVPGYCRIMRAAVLSVKGREFIEASRANGCRTGYIIVRHVVPNAFAPVLVQMTMNVGTAIVACASLSFMGVGIAAPTPEWGAMLSSGRDLLRDYSYITAFPGLAIMVTVLSLNLMGDGLRDALDPKLKR